jgi:hypothetical protein
MKSGLPQTTNELSWRSKLGQPAQKSKLSCRPVENWLERFGFTALSRVDPRPGVLAANAA